MASNSKRVKGATTNSEACDESSESDGETEPAKSFHRRLSTNKEIKCSAAIKEGFLMKQTWSFQRWRRRYFKLKGRKLYYAKDTKAEIFDEIELTDLSFAECSIKNVNHSFQVITPFRSLVLCAESRREMEDWLSALAAASQGRFHEPDQPDCLYGYHHWYATSHARPTYCNVCREALSGVTSHGLSCEVCKCKVHKRCAAKAINNCKWTTLSSVGKDIIEDSEGNILMPHQWIEGNLPVSAKCMICEKNCGSVLRLQDWRCLWCRGNVHTACRPLLSAACPLGPARVSVVPPTALHCIQDEAWDAVRPQASSPLLVFVNSKSGDNQGVKFLRRFKQLLNPAQVFDLISTGPRLGLRLFRHFDPFRILVCSGDGSVGWVLSEIDKLDMHKQCQIAVLPLGTGNDLARVLGWGSSCDDDTHLPQLLDKYERASTKMLDRWSIMTLERAFGLAAKFSLTPADTSHIDAQLRTLMTECEESVGAHIQKILQSDEVAVVLSSAKFVFESIKELLSHVTESAILKGDEKLISKSDVLQQNLDLLMQTLSQEDALSSELSEALEKIKQDMEPSLSTLSKDKSEKDLSNFKKSERTRRKLVHRESLVICTNNLKKAMRSFVECVEQFLDEQSAESEVKASRDKDMITLKVLPTIDSASSLGEASLCPSPSPLTSSRQSLLTARLTCISPLPDLRRDSACDDPDNLLTLPVPHEFADSRRSSHARKSSVGLDDDLKNINLVVSSTTLNIEQDNKSYNDQDSSLVVNLSDSSHLQQTVYENTVYKGQEKTDVKKTTEIDDDDDEDKECSSMMSAMSNEEISITSDILDQKSFIPRKDSDGEDINGHIYHIDSPEMSDTYPNSDALQGESLMDDISSLLGQDIFIAMAGLDQDSNENTYTDDTTLFASDTTDVSKELQYRRSLKKKKLEEIEAQYGFENRAFMTQNIFLEKDNRCDDQKLVEPIKYCSLAQFVEGNDIARKSFKRSRQRSTKLRKLETSAKPTTVTEETESLDNIKIEILGSNHSLNEIITTEFDIKTDEIIEIPVATKPEEMETSTEDTETRTTAFGPVSVVVEPPSPISSEQSRLERHELAMKRGSLTRGEFDYMKKLKDDYLFPNGEDSSHCSSNSNLLGIDSEYMNFLKSSPAASRRISSGSLLKAGEAAALAAVAAKDCENEKKDKKDDAGERNKRLPIINPLVTLPTWPNVSSGAGFISQCLLANADALCAAVSPLMDPDETLLEGFIERCVMNNYFGIGIDAKITLDFHNKREEHPEKCRSRAKNYMWYGVLGSKQWLQRTYRNLEQRVQLECDGQRIPLPSLQGIVILNIPSFMGGTNFWGSTKKDDIFLSPSFDDRILEVVAVFGSVQMAASRLINLQHHRIAQCQTVQINILGEEGVPVQVDGEAWVQPPGVIRIIHKNRMQMLCRNRALETSLRAWEEKLAAAAASGEKSRQPSISHGRQSLALPRQSITGLLGVNIGEKVRQQSFSGQGLTVPTPIEKSHSIQFIERLSAIEPDYLFTEEENALLLSFIECSTTLVKWVKILAISHSNIEVDLYSLASKTDTCLENIHPNGKILEGELLREEFTKLVDSAKNLYIECCCLLRDKGHNLKLREDLENKLSVSLANTEMELRKCVLVETPKGSLVYLQPLHEDQNERKNRKGLFWLKFRGKSLLSHGSSSGSTARDVASWGTSEVATWLETLQLAEYTDSFIRNDIRGRELLTLARRDLKDLGVTKVGHVKRILQAIKDLNQG